MPTIEFRTFHDKSHDLFRPVAFKDLQPDWWRKMKIRVDHRGRIVQTIKSCPSMLDWLTMGYYIVASEDIPIRNGSDWDYLTVVKDLLQRKYKTFLLHTLLHNS